MTRQSSVFALLATIFCAIPLASATSERARAPSPNKQTTLNFRLDQTQTYTSKNMLLCLHHKTGTTLSTSVLRRACAAAGKGRARDKDGELVQGKDHQPCGHDVEQGMSACCEGLKIDTMCPSQAMAAFESDQARLASGSAATKGRGEEAHDRSALGVKPNFSS